ncbi:MAG TPA: hypothetical protein VNX23_26170 [Bradyrhizobium sp.]|uniref:hypothetical protein n=1 Tax=Bradyrhizobium sp. TaxID=376 RepID=UPI002B7FBE9B|nr:hypothetical protein [Bradyrhizobium sp.]HXB80852.1 hypothetical protein [Bradyrhizobium sp.]
MRPIFPARFMAPGPAGATPAGNVPAASQTLNFAFHQRRGMHRDHARSGAGQEVATCVGYD